MIKVTALTSGRRVPSTRFRVLQHIEPLKKIGIEVQDCTPLFQKYASIPLQSGRLRSLLRVLGTVILQGTKLSLRIPGVISSWTSQITWLERELLPGRLTMERWLKKPLVFDVDDAIWLYPPQGALASQNIARFADVMIVGNQYLADWFSAFARDIRVIPTAIDTERFTPRPTSRDGNGPFAIGWTGTSSTITYLEALDEVLDRFVTEHRDVQLLVIADMPPRFRKLPSEHVKFIPWSPDSEVEAVRSMDVGIMPLPDNEWTRGKCGFKLLQYMACGIPAIASPVGMNRDVLNSGTLGLPAKTETDWHDALHYFYNHREQGEAYGNTGRSVAESHFSRNVVVKHLAKVFAELAR